MLKKLYLHEFKALFRWLKFVWIAIIAIAIINRGMYALIDYYINNMIESASPDASTNPIYRLLLALTSSLTVVYAFVTIAGMFVSFGVVIVRFYKNLFTSEGYFTFAIPITAKQHIWCKLLCGVVAVLMSMAVCALSLLINFLNTKVGVIIVQALRDINLDIDTEIKVHLIFYAIEFILVMIASIFVTNLTYYCAISFGQSFKNKIGGSVISYIIINLIFNCISSFISIFFSFGGSILSFIIDFDAIEPLALLHVLIMLSLLIEVGISAVFFAITSHRISKKLNLE